MTLDFSKLTDRRPLAVMTGISSIITGFIYITFPVIEAEARAWGVWAVAAGVLSMTSAVMPLSHLILKIIGIAGYCLLLFAQLLPIYLWLILAPVTDSPEGHVGTPLYVVPHILIVVFAIATIVKIYKEPSRSIEPRSMARWLAVLVALLGLGAGLIWWVRTPDVIRSIPEPEQSNVPTDTLVMVKLGTQGRWLEQLLGGPSYSGISVSYADSDEYIPGTSGGSSEQMFFIPERPLRPGAVVEVRIERGGKRPYSFHFRTAVGAAPTATPLPAEELLFLPVPIATSLPAQELPSPIPPPTSPVLPAR